jgi:two-component system LytT family sensor kinase
MDAVITNMLLAAASYTMINMLRFYRPGPKSGLYLCISAVCIAALKVFFFKCLLTYFFPFDFAYLAFIKASLFIRAIFALMMVSFTMLISWFSYYKAMIMENEARKGDAEKLARNAELSNLRQQLQPHFLFNSLNSINALIGLRSEEARKMIQQLSDFLRGTLKKDDQQLVSLSEELNHLQLYLDIEKVRFGHRLSTVIDSDTASMELRLPSLLLQPIVENAIKFGLYDTIGDITITIFSKYENGLLILEVENPYDSTTSQPRQGTGFGLNSVQRRLYLLYARTDLLSTQQNDNIFITKVKIPQSK